LRLTGFLALDDPAASERVMQDLLDAVQAALSQVVTAATLLAEHTRALDAVLLRLRALEQEQQALCQQRLRLEGAIAALQMLQDAARVSDVSQGGISGVDHVPGAAGGA
jgi:hypothetical protein